MLIVFARMSDSPIIVPSECMNKLLSGLPDALTRMIKIIEEWGCGKSLNDDNVLTGVLIKGRTPTGALGDYLEVVKGFLFPTVSRGSQAVFINGELVACRYGLQSFKLSGNCSITSILPDESPDPELMLRTYNALINSVEALRSKSFSMESVLTYFIAEVSNGDVAIHHSLLLSTPALTL